MQSSEIPYKFQYVWGENATLGFVTAPIPAISVSGTIASQSLGFPPATATDPGAGGVPPDVADFNGYGNYSTKWTQWTQAGGPVFYDATFSGWIGGYPRGAIIDSATAFGTRWLSTAENNTSNPDTGGGGWISGSKGRLIGVRVFTTPGSSTYVPTSGTGSIIIEAVGGGGGGGGAVTNISGNCSAGIPGSAGAFGRGYHTSGFAGQSIVVGAGGPGGTGGTGGNGATSEVTTLISCSGGFGGSGGISQVGSASGGNGSPSPGATGANMVSAAGGTGGASFGFSTGQVQYGGEGGASAYGGGGTGQQANLDGAHSFSPGAGGGGTFGNGNTMALVGGNGANGQVIIYEFSY